MKRVLFVVTKSENGGAQKWIKEQIELLTGEFEVYLVTDTSGWLAANVSVSDVMLDVRIRKKSSLLFLLRFIWFIQKNNIDLVVSSSANAGLYSRLASFITGVKNIYVSHGWSAIYNGGKFKFIYVLVERLLAKISDSVLCVSDSDLIKAKDVIKVKPEKLKLIQNKILPMEASGVYGLRERPRILSVARLVEPKRLDLLVEAVIGMDVDLFIVGDGPLRLKLEALSPVNVFFLGELEGFSRFCDFDVFTLISDSEGLPMSAIEAISAGLPLVISNVGGCSELISDNGVLVDNTLSSIKSGIESAINSYSDFSLASHSLFQRRFNLEKSKQEFILYYKTFL